MGLDGDSDGDIDVFWGYFPSSGFFGGVGSYLNEPDGFTNGGFSIQQSSATWDLAAGDLDGNGTTDLYQAVERFDPYPLFGADRILLSDGAGTFSADTSFPEPLQRTTDVELADADWDGDLDIFLTGDAPLYFRNDGMSWTDRSADLPFTAAEALAVDDINANGLADIVVIQDGQAVIYRDFHEPGIPPEILLDRPSLVDVGLYDADFDGDPDLFLGIEEPITDSSQSNGLQSGFSRYYPNKGGGSGSFGPSRRLGFQFREGTGFADIDFDGDLDAGLAGTFHRNLTRHLSWSAVPSVGNDLRLDLRGEALSPWVLFSSSKTANKPASSLGTWLLDPTDIVLESSGTLDDEGRALFEAPIPPLPELIGMTRYWQAIVDETPRLTNREATTLSGL